MATESEANIARDQHAELLRKRGATAISVDKATIEGKQTFVVAVRVDPGSVTRFPANLSANVDGSTIEVPLVVKAAPAFRPD